MRTFALLLVIGVALAGCGSKGSAPPAPTVSTYKDSSFGFSFKYPSSWSVPAGGGHVINQNGVQTYVLDIGVPGSSTQASITVDGDVVPLPSFQNGKTAPDPNGPTHTFQYFHGKISGWPAMVVHRFTGKQVSEIDTIANTRTKSYDVRMLTVSPPFSVDQQQGYHTIASSMKVPFS